MEECIKYSKMSLDRRLLELPGIIHCTGARTCGQSEKLSAITTILHMTVQVASDNLQKYEKIGFYISYIFHMQKPQVHTMEVPCYSEQSISGRFMAFDFNLVKTECIEVLTNLLSLNRSIH